MAPSTDYFLTKSSHPGINFVLLSFVYSESRIVDHFGFNERIFYFDVTMKKTKSYLERNLSRKFSLFILYLLYINSHVLGLLS